MSDNDTRHERVKAAYDYLAAHGTPEDRDHLTIAAAAEAIGTSRTSLYGHWATAGEFADDVTALRALPADAWQHELADRWGSVGLAEALTEVLTGALRSGQRDAVLRSSLSVRSARSPARARVAAWERDWVNEFADHLRETYGSDPEEPWTDIAVTLAALIEGMFLLRQMLAGSPEASSHEHDVELTVSTISRMAPYLAEHARGDAGALVAPSDEPPERPRRSGAVRLLERTVRAIDSGDLHRDATDRRLIDMEAFARQQGVTSRALYKRWPAATDLNADLFGEGVRRVRDGIANIGLATFATSTGSGFNYFTPLLLHINEEVLRVDVFPEARPFISMIELATHPDVLARHGVTIRDWFADGQMFAAALLQASGRRPVPGFSLADHTWLAVASEFGAWRMVAMHPQLMERRIDYLGVDVVALAAGIDAHTEVWTDHDEVPTAERSGPPLPSIRSDEDPPAG